MYEKLTKGYLTIIILGIMYIATFWVFPYLVRVLHLSSTASAITLFIVIFLISLAILVRSTITIRKASKVEKAKLGAILMFVFAAISIMMAVLSLYVVMIPVSANEKDGDLMLGALIIGFAMFPQVLIYIAGMICSVSTYGKLKQKDVEDRVYNRMQNK